MKLTERLHHLQRSVAEVGKRSREKFGSAIRSIGSYWAHEWSEVSHVRLYLAAVSAGTLLIGGSYFAVDKIQTTGSWVRVFSNGAFVGMVPDTADVVGGVQRIADGYNVAVRMKPVHTHLADGYDWQSVARLPSQAVAIRYDGQVLAYTASRSGAKQVLNQLKAAYTPKGLGKHASVRFVGKVNLEKTFVGVSMILQPDAVTRMLEQSNHGRLVGRSQSLGGLISDVKPKGVKLAAKSLVQASTPHAIPHMEVQVQSKLTKVLAIPYPVHYLKDAHLGVGSVSVVTKGTPGEVKEQVLVTYINGQQSRQQVLKKDVLQTPVAEVADQGTNAGIASGSWGWPTDQYDITSGFGWRTLGGVANFHPGVDVGVPIGSPVYATNNGVVEQAGWNAGGYGNWVLINNGNGIETVFGHLSAVEVHSGETVAKGDLIGKSGDTGFSTGPHLHYEVRLNGTAIAPQKYM